MRRVLVAAVFGFLGYLAVSIALAAYVRGLSLGEEGAISLAVGILSGIVTYRRMG